VTAANHNTPAGMDAFYGTAARDYYAGRASLFERVAILVDVLTERRSALRVLEVGCGAGHLLAAIDSRMGHRIATLRGVDYSKVAILKAAEVCPAALYVWMDITRPTVQLTADVIVCSQTLEHIADADTALRNMLTWLAPGGVLVLTVPDGARDDYDGHAHHWTEEQLAWLLAPLGGVVHRLSEAHLWAEVRP
jgi:trans-aconitate methyltransferase